MRPALQRQHRRARRPSACIRLQRAVLRRCVDASAALWLRTERRGRRTSRTSGSKAWQRQPRPTPAARAQTRDAQRRTRAAGTALAAPRHVDRRPDTRRGVRSPLCAGTVSGNGVNLSFLRRCPDTQHEGSAAGPLRLCACAAVLAAPRRRALTLKDRLRSSPSTAPGERPRAATRRPDPFFGSRLTTPPPPHHGPVQFAGCI
jgi:hypothetical protein